MFYESKFVAYTKRFIKTATSNFQGYKMFNNNNLLILIMSRTITWLLTIG